MARHTAYLVLSIALLAAMHDAAFAKGGVVVIGNAALPISRLSIDELGAIYLRRETLWPGGQEIIAVNQGVSSVARRRFSRNVFKEPPEALGEYWIRMHFLGKNPPLVLGSDAAVAAFVRRVPGAVGYVNADTPLVGVKVLEHVP